MKKNAEHLELLKEARELDEKIKKFGTQNSEANKNERVVLINKYNKTKDAAQNILGQLAESQGISIGVLYKRLNINIDVESST